jgi:hypothetical protein
MVKGTRQMPARPLLIKVLGSKKDFPAKDFGRKKGWDYSITVCTCGNLLYAQKSYCKCCKGTIGYTVKCDCPHPYSGRA